MFKSDLLAQKEKMVEFDLKSRGITDVRVLQAMSQVPREKFVPDEFIDYSYADHPLPVGYGQTISQPFIVAMTCQLAQIQPTDQVLDIGTGSGYQAAILSHLAKKVVSVEIVPGLYQTALQRFQSLGYDNILTILGDGKQGYLPNAPYDQILSAAATSRIPKAWIAQLKIGGQIVLPLITNHSQILTSVHKVDSEKIQTQPHLEVAFVPLV